MATDTKWLELSVRTPQEFVEPLSQIFYRHGRQGVAVEIEGGFNPDEGETGPKDDQWAIVRTYLPINSSTKRKRNHIDLGVRLVSKVAPISPLQERVLEPKAWEEAWKEHFQVLHVGRSIVIRPTWREYQPKENEVVIDLDPGMAFGTGHHPTTRMCLHELEDLLRPGINVLDVGTGSAVLSIAAAKMGAEKVLALDVDPIAIKVGRANVRANKVRNKVKVVPGSLPCPQVEPGAFDLVLANISAWIISKMSRDLVAALKPGGTLVASGMIVDKRGETESNLEQAGAVVDRVITEGDWITVVASRPRARPAPAHSTLV